MNKLEKLLTLNGIPPRVEATKEELTLALMEIAQNQADLEDALVELAEMLAGEGEEQ